MRTTPRHSRSTAAKFQQRLREDVDTARPFVTVSRRLHLLVPLDPLRRCPSHLRYRLASYLERNGWYPQEARVSADFSELARAPNVRFLPLVRPTAHPFPGDTVSNLLYRLVSPAFDILS